MFFQKRTQGQDAVLIQVNIQRLILCEEKQIRHGLADHPFPQLCRVIGGCHLLDGNAEAQLLLCDFAQRRRNADTGSFIRLARHQHCNHGLCSTFCRRFRPLPAAGKQSRSGCSTGQL